MRNDENRTSLILAVCGIVPVVWLALLTAPYVSGGIVEIIGGLSAAINQPFSITVCEDSVKTVLIFLLAYAMGIGIYLSTRRNYRRREEHGSAKWGNAGTLNKKYRDKDASQNKLLTQNVRIGLDGRKHRRNLNILVCGGSGAGKTRFFCKPNAMQCNTSMVILDPKGEIVRDVGGLLEKKGYEVRVLDLINMHKETIDTNTYGKSSGRSGNYSTNYQISGRELLTPDEVRMLDNRYALLFVRGERPIMDFKYDILKHPNVKLTADGGQPPYIHGEPTQAVATLVFDSDIPENAVSVNAVSTSYELLSEEDLEELFNL